MTDAKASLPYRLLGSTGRARLQQKLEGVARRWLDAWTSTKATPCAVRILDGDETRRGARAPVQSVRVRSGSGIAADVRIDQHRLGLVLGVPLDRWAPSAAKTSSSSLADRMWQALMRGLVNELMDSASIAAWELEQLDHTARRPPARPTSQEASIVVGDDVVAHLELGPLVVNALVPLASAVGGTKTEPRRRAIGTERLRVEAVLGAVELSLADFASLGEGDVVVLDARIGSECRLDVPGVATVADAVPGRQGTARAVRVRSVQIGR